MKIDTLMNVLEVLIMVSDTPLTADKLCSLVDHNDVTIKEVKTALEELANIYQGRGIGLKKVGSGYRFQAREEYKEWFHKLFTERPAKYSRALLETLAIIAYRQPVTRADVEAIRGVAVSSSIMRTLIEREWIKVVGHRDVPGKPSIYATTKVFLDYFNIARLDDLPPLSEVKELADIMEKGEQSEIKLQSELALSSDENTEVTAEIVSEDESTGSLVDETMEGESIKTAEEEPSEVALEETIKVEAEEIVEDTDKEETQPTFAKKIQEDIEKAPLDADTEEEVV